MQSDGFLIITYIRDYDYRAHNSKVLDKFCPTGAKSEYCFRMCAKFKRSYKVLNDYDPQRCAEKIVLSTNGYRRS